MSITFIETVNWNSVRDAIARTDKALAQIAPAITQMQRILNMVDANVTAVQGDVATLKTNVAAVQQRIADLLGHQGTAIDNEDLDIIKQMHTDLVAVNDGLQALVMPPPPPLTP